ncbi:MAG: hypothetical protein Q8P84_02415 [Deltaproteobacteria bacterium]|nr:hypothetical protein [Deltaproteobacteria bacterium]
MSEIIFRAGQNNDAAFLRLKEELEAKARSYVRKAFDHYAEGQPQMDAVFRRFLSRSNLKKAVFPKSPLTREDIRKLGRQTKEVSFSLEEVNRAGVITTYRDIDQADAGMLAGLFVLPAPVGIARPAVNRQELYKKFRPHVDDSRRCKLENGKSAYFTSLTAIGFSVGSVLYSNELSDGSHFHLQSSCRSREGTVLKTDGIVKNMDGLKIYFPIVIEEDGVAQEKTVTVSANISVWGGLPGILMGAVSSSKKMKTYSMAGFTEILMVVKATDTSGKHNPKAE